MSDEVVWNLLIKSSFASKGEDSVREKQDFFFSMATVSLSLTLSLETLTDSPARGSHKAETEDP